ncbi:MAG: hypothetical protein HQ483_06320 [Rhodospirillales bacterium]|nr:hypothetical protein [Rhodospirillales bacterium]
MLQLSPETTAEISNRTAADDAVVCLRCQSLITRNRWQISVGGHAHRFSNPLGRVFHIRCFELAPGILLTGAPTGDFTWFADYLWAIALCGACKTHMGWHFSGGINPPQFFGLIKNRLSQQAPATGGQEGN